jgi:hypothetical protein
MVFMFPIKYDLSFIFVFLVSIYKEYFMLKFFYSCHSKNMLLTDRTSGIYTFIARKPSNSGEVNGGSIKKQNERKKNVAPEFYLDGR